MSEGPTVGKDSDVGGNNHDDKSDEREPQRDYGDESEDGEEELQDEAAASVEGTSPHDAIPQRSGATINDGEVDRGPTPSGGAKKSTKEDLIGKHDSSVRTLLNKLHSTLDRHTVEDFRDCDNKAMCPGAVTLVVSPRGDIDFRVSDRLLDIDLVKKYVWRLCWAISKAMQERKFDASEEDLGDVNKDELPPGWSKRNVDRSNEYHTRLRNAGNTVVRFMGEKLRLQAKYCRYEDRKICNQDHSPCKEERKKWGWPDKVPFVSTSYMLDKQIEWLIEHYLEQMPSDFVMPVQVSHPRQVTLFMCSSDFISHTVHVLTCSNI